MEKLGQLRRDARDDRPLGPDRRRHPAGAVGAGLPRRPRAAVGLPRRPLHPAAARPAKGPARLMTAGLSARSPTRWPRSSAPRCSRTCRCSSPPSTPCSAGSGSGPSRPSSCCRPRRPRSSSSPRPSPTRCARRRTSSSGSTPSRCRWPGWWSTGPRRALDGAVRRAGGRSRRAARAGAATDAPGGSTAGLLRLHADRTPRSSTREATAAAALRSRAPARPDRRRPGPVHRRARPRRAAARSATLLAG